MKIIKVVMISLGLVSMNNIAIADSINDTYSTGQTLTTTMMNNIKSAVNDNNNDIATNASNLSNLVNSLDSSFHVYITRTQDDADGVGSASCAAGEVLMSSGCYCNGDGSTSNFGVLFACYPVSSTVASGACFPESVTYNPALQTSIKIYAVCGSTVTFSNKPQAKPSENDEVDVDLHMAELTEKQTRRINLLNQSLQ